MVKITGSPHLHEDNEDRHAREVASMYGLTPKVEAAIRYTIQNEQWNRLKMLMDPLHPADKADFLERISAEDLRILVRQLCHTTHGPRWQVRRLDDLCLIASNGSRVRAPSA